MNFCKALFESSLGRKYLMALTGVALLLFVIGHLAGNLQVFAGRDKLNAYAHFLQANQGLLWMARVGLLVAVALHIWAALKLAAENKAARPIGYAETKWHKASYASRTMVMSGLIVAAFVVYHLLHFTVQVRAVNLTGTDFPSLQDNRGRHDVFAMMILGFSSPWVSLFYLIAMGLLCMHLGHGASSMFQSLGLKNKPYGAWIDRCALVAATLIFAGYASIPVAILLGYGK
jgi:succinate dehydrogenase / fumarate reductase, cytochrome b subunit